MQISLFPENLSDIEIKARAGKIVAGLEPENTNILLHAIGKAIDSNVDSSEYIKKLHSQDKKTNETKGKKSTLAKKTNKISKDKEIISKITKNKSNETPKSKRSTPKESPKATELSKKNQRENENDKTLKTDVENILEEREINNAQISKSLIDEKINDKLDVNNYDGDSNQIDTNKDSGIETDQIDIDNEDANIDNTRIKANFPEQGRTLRSASARPKSARPKSGEKEKVKADGGKLLEMTGNYIYFVPMLYSKQNFHLDHWLIWF